MNLQAMPRVRAFFRDRAVVSVRGSDTGAHVAAAPVPRPKVAAVQKVMMSITVDAGVVASLRRVVMSACGEWVEIMRVQPVIRSNDMKVSIGMHSSAVSHAMNAIMRILPRAEFGHITAL
jgi:hypothetical protein